MHTSNKREHTKNETTLRGFRTKEKTGRYDKKEMRRGGEMRDLQNIQDASCSNTIVGKKTGARGVSQRNLSTIAIGERESRNTDVMRVKRGNKTRRKN